jgi:hypothetical protein
MPDILHHAGADGGNAAFGRKSKTALNLWMKA